MRALIAASLMLSACAAAGGAATEPSRFCLLSVQEDGGGLVQLDLASGASRFTPVGPAPHEVAVSDDGATAYVSQFGMRDFSHETGTAGDRVVEIDLRDGTSRAFMLPEGLRGPHGVGLAAGEVFTNAEIGDAMVVFDAASGAVRRTMPIPRNVHAFTFSADGRALFAFALGDGVYKLDAQSGAVLAHADLGSPARSVQVFDGGRGVLAAARGEVVVLSADDLAVRRRIAVAGVSQVIYAELSEAHGLLLAPAPGENVVVILDFASGEERARISEGRVPTGSHFGPDGMIYINNVGDSFVTAVDPADFSTTRVGSLQRPNGLGFGACRR